MKISGQNSDLRGEGGPGAHTFIKMLYTHIHIYSGRFPPSGDGILSHKRAPNKRASRTSMHDFHIPSLIKEKNALKMVLERRNMV